jgi:hypothetical protein
MNNEITITLTTEHAGLILSMLEPHYRACQCGGAPSVAMHMMERLSSILVNACAEVEPESIGIFRPLPAGLDRSAMLAAMEKALP